MTRQEKFYAEKSILDFFYDARLDRRREFAADLGIYYDDSDWLFVLVDGVSKRLVRVKRHKCGSAVENFANRPNSFRCVLIASV